MCIHTTAIGGAKCGTSKVPETGDFDSKIAGQTDISKHRINTTFTPNWWSQIWVLEYLDGRNVRLAQGETIELQITPNPATSFIQLNGIDTPLNYEIYDTSGKLVLQGEGQTMDVSTLANGTYLLVGYLKNEDGTDSFARGIFIKN